MILDHSAECWIVFSIQRFKIKSLIMQACNFVICPGSIWVAHNTQIRIIYSLVTVIGISPHMIAVQQSLLIYIPVDLIPKVVQASWIFDICVTYCVCIAISSRENKWDTVCFTVVVNISNSSSICGNHLFRIRLVKVELILRLGYCILFENKIRRIGSFSTRRPRLEFWTKQFIIPRALTGVWFVLYLIFNPVFNGVLCIGSFHIFGVQRNIAVYNAVKIIGLRQFLISIPALKCISLFKRIILRLNCLFLVIRCIQRNELPVIGGLSIWVECYPVSFLYNWVEIDRIVPNRKFPRNIICTVRRKWPSDERGCDTLRLEWRRIIVNSHFCVRRHFLAFDDVAILIVIIKIYSILIFRVQIYRLISAFNTSDFSKSVKRILREITSIFFIPSEKALCLLVIRTVRGKKGIPIFDSLLVCQLIAIIKIICSSRCCNRRNDTPDYRHNRLCCRILCSCIIRLIRGIGGSHITRFIRRISGGRIVRFIRRISGGRIVRFIRRIFCGCIARFIRRTLCGCIIRLICRRVVCLIWRLTVRIICVYSCARAGIVTDLLPVLCRRIIEILSWILLIRIPGFFRLIIIRNACVFTFFCLCRSRLLCIYLRTIAWTDKSCSQYDG